MLVYFTVESHAAQPYYPLVSKTMSAAESSLDDFYTSNSPHKRTLDGALEDEFDRISITQGSPPLKMTRLHDERDQMPVHTCEGKHIFIKHDVSRIRHLFMKHDVSRIRLCMCGLRDSYCFNSIQKAWLLHHEMAIWA